MFGRNMVLTLAAGVVLAAIGFAGEAGKAEKPVWPFNAQVVEARLAKMPEPGADGMFSLPQFRAYDAQGHRLLDIEGYPRDFADRLSKLLASGGEADASHPLSRELASVVSPDGKPVASLPEAGLTFVKYWADWCVPCHAQSRDLVKLLGEHPGVRVALLNVEADPMKMGEAGGQPVRRVNLEEIDPEAARKLKDPNLTEEQKKKILSDALEKSRKQEAKKKDKP